MVVLRFSITVSPQKGCYDAEYYSALSRLLQNYIDKNEISRLVAASERGSDSQFTHFQIMLEESSSQTSKERREIWRQRFKYLCQKLPGYSKHTIKVVDRTPNPDLMGYPLKELEDFEREQVMLHSVTVAEAEELRDNCPSDMKENRGRKKFDPFPYLDEIFKDNIESFENGDDFKLQVARMRVLVATSVAHRQCPAEVMNYVRSYPDVFVARLQMYLVAMDKLPSITVGNDRLRNLSCFEVCLGEQTEKKRKRLGGDELAQYVDEVAEVMSEERRRRDEEARAIELRRLTPPTHVPRPLAAGPCPPQHRPRKTARGAQYINASQNVEFPAVVNKYVADFDFLDNASDCSSLSHDS